VCVEEPTGKLVRLPSPRSIERYAKKGTLTCYQEANEASDGGKVFPWYRESDLSEEQHLLLWMWLVVDGPGVFHGANFIERDRYIWKRHSCTHRCPGGLPSGVLGSFGVNHVPFLRCVLIRMAAANSQQLRVKIAVSNTYLSPFRILLSQPILSMAAF
jgi:hypothetical protein